MQRPDAADQDQDDQPLTVRDIPELRRHLRARCDPANPDRISPSSRKRFVAAVEDHIVWLTEQALAGTTLQGEDGGSKAAQ